MPSERSELMPSRARRDATPSHPKPRQASWGGPRGQAAPSAARNRQKSGLRFPSQLGLAWLGQKWLGWMVWHACEGSSLACN
eukprot:15455996-Alexandrium_andersonii.AAC.2